MNEIESLYRDNYSALVQLASRSVGRTRAEDVVQQAFTELLEGMAGDEDPLAYLVRRARNKAASERKLGRRQAAILLKEYGKPYLNEPNKGVQHGAGHQEPPKAYAPGQLTGFPYNTLGESTWT
jgi:DNA-directed RNA polymerase specialized sigma24 family protein